MIVLSRVLQKPRSSTVTVVRIELKFFETKTVLAIGNEGFLAKNGSAEPLNTVVYQTAPLAKLLHTIEICFNNYFTTTFSLWVGNSVLYYTDTNVDIIKFDFLFSDGRNSSHQLETRYIEEETILAVAHTIFAQLYILIL